MIKSYSKEVSATIKRFPVNSDLIQELNLTAWQAERDCIKGNRSGYIMQRLKWQCYNYYRTESSAPSGNAINIDSIQVSAPDTWQRIKVLPLFTPAERKILTLLEIENNVFTIKAVARKLLSEGRPPEIKRKSSYRNLLNREQLKNRLLEIYQKIQLAKYA